MVDGFCFLEGFVGVARDEELNGFAAALHASGGVDAGTDFENHVGDGDFASRKAADAHDGPQAHVGVGVDATEAVVGEDTVFAGHRHDVGGDANGDEVEKGFEVDGVDAVGLGEPLHELVSDAASREVGIGVGGAFEFRVEDCGSRGQLVVGDVVVANDEIDAERGGIFDFLDGLNAAVEDYDEFDALLVELVDYAMRDAISVVVAGGDIVSDVGVVIAEILVDERHSGSAVDIVVSVNHNALLASHGTVETSHCEVHLGHQEGVVEVAQGRAEELFSLLNRRHTSLNQKLANSGCVGITLCQRRLYLLFFGCQG